MRLCLPARMGGGGKAESLPWSGPAGEARHTGATILLGETRGQSPWRSRQSGNGGDQPPPPQCGKETAPLHGATQPSGVAGSEAGTRLLSRRGSAASPRESATVARPARREARVPAGQLKNAAPSRSALSAGKSATLENPAHFPALLIVTGTAKTMGLVRAANRAGRR